LLKTKIVFAVDYFWKNLPQKETGSIEAKLN